MSCYVCYQPVSDVINIINMLQKESMSEAELKRKVEISVLHYTVLKSRQALLDESYKSVDF